MFCWSSCQEKLEIGPVKRVFKTLGRWLHVQNKKQTVFAFWSFMALCWICLLLVPCHECTCHPQLCGVVSSKPMAGLVRLLVGCLAVWWDHFGSRQAAPPFLVKGQREKWPLVVGLADHWTSIQILHPGPTFLHAHRRWSVFLAADQEHWSP